MNLFWFFPTAGDGHYLGSSIRERKSDSYYLTQLATALDYLGYDGALLPTGAKCEDAWITASYLASATNRLKFLVALRPGIMSPTLSARMALSLDHLSNGRLLLNIVTGGDPEEQAGFGNYLDHDKRYELTGEFLTVWKALMHGEKVDFDGNHIKVTGAEVPSSPVQKPYPPLYFGGSSPAGKEVGSEHSDVYLLWGEPPEKIKERMEEMTERAAKQGRTLQFGIRMHVIVRESEEKAWEAAEALISHVDDAAIKNLQKKLLSFDSVAQRGQTNLHKGSKNRDDLELSPNLWAGIGLAREGAGTALVGDPETVAERIREYKALGIDTFILSGYPHLEEAYTFAELVFPLLKKDGI